MKQKKYSKLNHEQRSVLAEALKTFKCENITELGKFFGFRRPYRQMANAIKSDTAITYIRIIIETKRKEQKKIEILTQILQEYRKAEMKEKKFVTSLKKKQSKNEIDLIKTKILKS